VTPEGIGIRTLGAVYVPLAYPAVAPDAMDSVTTVDEVMVAVPLPFVAVPVVQSIV
jgi:hypothetical protein